MLRDLIHYLSAYWESTAVDREHLSSLELGVEPMQIAAFCLSPIKRWRRLTLRLLGVTVGLSSGYHHEQMDKWIESTRFHLASSTAGSASFFWAIHGTNIIPM